MAAQGRHHSAGKNAYVLNAKFVGELLRCSFSFSHESQFLILTEPVATVSFNPPNKVSAPESHKAIRYADTSRPIGTFYSSLIFCRIFLSGPSG